MKHRLTLHDRDAISVYMRSPKDLNGWAQTNPVTITLISNASAVLFEIDMIDLKVRLTDLGRIPEEWA